MRRAEGGALREALRHFYSVTVTPMARLIEEELSKKLDMPISFRFPERIRTDIAAIQRGYMGLSKTSPKWAAEIVGLPEPPEQVENQAETGNNEPVQVTGNNPVSVNGNSRRHLNA